MMIYFTAKLQNEFMLTFLPHLQPLIPLWQKWQAEQLEKVVVVPAWAKECFALASKQMAEHLQPTI